MIDKLLTDINKLGFEIAQPFQVGQYNRSVAEKFRLPDFNSDSNLAILIGSQSGFWEKFVKYLCQNPTKIECDNPFDNYSEKILKNYLNNLTCDFNISFPYKSEPSYLPFQKMAVLSGLAYLSDAQLCIHPKYGSWFSMRAVVVLSLPFSETANELVYSPCNINCADNCKKFFDLAIEAQGCVSEPSGGMKDKWHDWLRVRDSCSHGINYRYSDAQIDYHYTGDKNILKSLISEETFI